MKEKLTPIHFQNKYGKFIVSENPLGQETFTMFPHYSDKKGHKERSIINKAIKKTGLPKGLFYI